MQAESDACDFIYSGAVATLTASYLIHVRTTDEPELSTQRVDRLDRLIRDCEVFELRLNAGDIGNINPDMKLDEFQQTLDDITKPPIIPQGPAENM